MRIVITGATGFVGRNLVLAALAKPEITEVVAAVRSPSKLRAQLDAEPELNAEQRGRLLALNWADALRGIECDAVVHCAGLLFGRSRKAIFDANVNATMALLQAVPRGARMVVLSSQSAGGPTPDGVESRSMAHPDAPVTWYGKSKLEMERRVREQFANTAILRPPMILGPRDQATLPLFKMAKGAIQIKPGTGTKALSWIDVSDLVHVLTGIACGNLHPDWAGRTDYIAAPTITSDLDLIATASRLQEAKTGKLVQIPNPILRALSAVVDTIGPLRSAIPSLTRDRAKELFFDNWVVDGEASRKISGIQSYATLEASLGATLDWYRLTKAL